MSKSTIIPKMLSERSPQRWKPHKYQLKSLEFVLKRCGSGLLLDPGMGKTSIILKLLTVLRKAKAMRAALVIAPLRVCQQVWPAEQQDWIDFHGLRMIVLHGAHKDALLHEKADVFVINPEGLPWLFSSRRFDVLRADVLVVDESSKFKHPATQRFKIIKPFLSKFKRRHILTGSPAPNGYLDLFGQIYILDLGKALSPYVSHYRANYFSPAGTMGFKWVLNPESDKAIQQRIRPLCLRLEAKDYLELPTEVPLNIRVELPPKARRIYDELEEEMFAELDNGAVVTAVNAGVLSGKCSQVANGGIFYYPEDRLINPKLFTRGKRMFANLHTAKVDAVLELIDELNGSPVLIAYDYEHDLSRLLKALGKNAPYIGGGVSLKRSAEIEREWNAGNLPYVLGHPQSVAHGLNLQRGQAKHVCWHSLTWDFEVYDQFNKRVCRQGNKQKQVFIHHILAYQTVDEAKLRALKGKDKAQRSLLNALKAYRRTRQ